MSLVQIFKRFGLFCVLCIRAGFLSGIHSAARSRVDVVVLAVPLVHSLRLWAVSGDCWPVAGWFRKERGRIQSLNVVAASVHAHRRHSKGWFSLATESES